MQKLATLPLIFLLFSMTSCIDAASRHPTPRANTSGISAHQKRVNDWIGATVSEMIAKWGAPTKTFTIAGKEYVAYVFESTITQGGSPGGRFQSGTSGYSYDVTDCTYTFEIRRGVIVGGNAVDGRAGGCSRR